ncbi:T9SS type A sorting domain-containing protein [Chitinophaga rhizophila]|uniref:T9SS type A sorting domain-containing protein n=1 Tax=Chitinophaga rhizophila TaxID=2866212 RepID=A0ABS7G9I2_9BACT|nr:T9SS type A sorting domain-containing protein [Chitinophaga rhizophila]MBW8684304.1 T9SS type A sorting domain-containing protein [Chitinophaga rhizophila]
MKIIYKQLLLLCLTASGITQARAQLILNRQVNASTGGGGPAGDFIFQYTIGEITVSSLQKSAIMLTQGFHQPEEIPPAIPGAEVVVNLILYPNPVSSVLKIQFDMLSNNAVVFFIVNSSGQVVHQESRTYGSGKVLITLPVTRFAAGIYTVVLRAGGHAYEEKLVIQ